MEKANSLVLAKVIKPRPSIFKNINYPYFKIDGGKNRQSK